MTPYFMFCNLDMCFRKQHIASYEEYQYSENNELTYVIEMTAFFLSFIVVLDGKFQYFSRHTLHQQAATN